MTAPSEDIPVTATATVEDIPAAKAEADPGTPRLAVENLRIVMAAARGRPEADVVDQVSFTVQPGHVLGLVGESGSGKTTVALALLGLVKRGLAIGGGKVLIDGRDILGLSEHELQKVRGRTVAYVPQDPGSALNPVLKVGTQLHEVFAIHGGDADRLPQVMAEAGLEDPGPILASYPHQLSGGQQQRVALAMAFACRPRLIVLDEPTTGLDVTTQRRVLDTVRGLCRTYQVAAVYISHDLAVVAEIADHVAVLYSGRLIEIGEARELFASPAHPYTRGLMRAIPSMESAHELHGIAGSPPRPGNRPTGCSFRPRCEFAIAECELREPEPVVVSDTGHAARCVRALEVITLSGTALQARERTVPAEPRSRCSPSAGYRSPTRTSRCCGTSTSTWGPRSRSRSSVPQGRARPRWPGASLGCTRTGRGRSRSTASSSRPACGAGRRTSCARSSSSRRTRTRLTQSPADDRPDHRESARALHQAPRQGARQADRGRADLRRAAGVVRGALPRRALRRGAAAGRAGPRPRRRP